MALKRRTRGGSLEAPSAAPSNCSSVEASSLEAKNLDKQKKRNMLLRCCECLQSEFLRRLVGLFYVLPACSVALSHLRINASFDGYKHRAKVISSILTSSSPTARTSARAPLDSPEVRVLSSRPAGPPIWCILNFLSQNEVKYVLESYEPYLASNIGGFPSLLRPFFGCAHLV